MLPILTGHLSKNDFGVYSLVTMITTIASAVLYLGMTSALPRSYFDYECKEDRKQIFTTAFLVLIAGALLQSTIAYLYSSEIALVFLGDLNYGSSVSWALFGGALTFINQFFFTYLRLLRKSLASVVFSLFSLIATIFLTLYFLDLAPGNLSAPFKAITFAQLIIALVFVLFYGSSAFVFKIKTVELPNLFHFGAASIVASFGHMLLEWLDRLIINYHMTLADVGDYSAAFRVGMLVNVVLVVPLTQIWSPMMLEYRNKKNIEELFSLVFSLFIIFGGVVIIFSALFAQDLLPLLVRYSVDQQMVVIFLITAIGVLIYGTTNFVAAGLIYERKIYRLASVYYLVSTIKLLANLSLIPIFGLVGASVAYLLTSTLIPVGVYLFAKKYFVFHVPWWRVQSLTLIVAPALVYAFWGAFHYTVGLTEKLLWLTTSLVLIYCLCFSKAERSSVKRFLDDFLK